MDAADDQNHESDSSSGGHERTDKRGSLPPERKTSSSLTRPHSTGYSARGHGEAPRDSTASA